MRVDQLPSWVSKTIPGIHAGKPTALVGIENDTRYTKGVHLSILGIENDTQHTEGVYTVLLGIENDTWQLGNC